MGIAVAVRDGIVVVIWGVWGQYVSSVCCFAVEDVVMSVFVDVLMLGWSICSAVLVTRTKRFLSVCTRPRAGVTLVVLHQRRTLWRSLPTVWGG